MKHLKFALILAVLLALGMAVGVFAQGPDSYDTGFQIANLDTNSVADIMITFYNQDGTVDATVPDTIAKGDSNSYYPIPGVSSDFNGSVVVSSNTDVAAIVNLLGTKGGGPTGNFGGADYNGLKSGSEFINIPQVMRNFFEINSFFNVQNAGAADATVTVTYTGNKGTCSEAPVTIKPGAAATFDQSTSTASCMTSGFLGAALVEAGSGDSIVAAIVQYDAKSLLAYNGFNSLGEPDVLVPFVSQQWYGSRTGIQIQNTGNSATTVTLSYNPSAGFPGTTCSETKSIAPKSSENFGDIGFFESPSFPCGPMSGSNQNQYGFVGSAEVTGNTGAQNLLATVNTVTSGTPNAATYNAFNPSTATSKVSFPQIMDMYFDIFTGFSVVNAGTQPTNINCTYTGGYPSDSLANVPTGGAMTVTNLGKVPNYLGAATCTASGGDAKIVGIVSQVGGVAGSDLLLYYEGVNN